MPLMNFEAIDWDQLDLLVWTSIMAVAMHHLMVQ